MLSAFILAVVIGALLFHQRVADIEKWMVLFVILFAAVGYLGYVVGNSYLLGLSDGWIHALWLTCTFIFVGTAFTSFKPFHGFFEKGNQRMWISLLLLFFLAGAFVNVWFSVIFTYLFLIVLFPAGLFIGFWIQGFLSDQWPRFYWLPFVPLLFLVFSSVGKLL